MHYGSRVRGVVRAVDDVSMRVHQGEVLGLVGESGSGKSTLGRAVIGAAPINSGEISIDGIDLRRASRRQRQQLLRQIGVVFQNPARSLNPRYTAYQSVAEPLAHLLGLADTKLKRRTQELLEAVRLSDEAHSYPHQLSGGQQQRVAIARAVAANPVLLIADEPTSALDVSVQAQVLDIFRELQRSLSFAVVFITHDLAVVNELCDSVAVMQNGRLVEFGQREQVLMRPEHEYTRRLIDSVPCLEPRSSRVDTRR